MAATTPIAHRTGRSTEPPHRPQLRHAEDLPEAFADGVAQFLGRPRARGWIHVYSAVVAFIAGARAGRRCRGR